MLLLKVMRCEHALLYAVIGAVAAAPLLSLVFFWDSTRVFDFGEDEWIPATIAGGASAFRWGRWRQRLAARAAEDRKRPNPIHDLLF